MMHKRYEYSFSQAILDERRNGCAPEIMCTRLLSLGMAEEVQPDSYRDMCSQCCDMSANRV
jgi:hypothetical protein